MRSKGKHFILLVLLGLGFADVKAQTAFNMKQADSSYKNVYAVNATAFVKQFLPHNSHSPFSYNPYLFTYKRYTRNNIYLRVSMAYNAVTNVLFFQSFDVSSPKNVDLGIGAEKRMYIGNHLAAYYGMDLQQGYSRNFGTESSFGLRYAIAPLAGLEYYITPRIRVSTEASVNLFLASSGYFRLYRTASDIVTKALPGGGIQFLPPDFINLSIAF